MISMKDAMKYRLNLAGMTYLVMLFVLYSIATSQAIWSFAYIMDHD